ncbi:hypothetical protein A33Q_3624 [Indibacter alkaliphilus LW1]|uniref:Uncharacterized protein n=2 Tax=Indibacter TaxID=647744 RepID=S2DV12_INDAL|nr:hypothetical protein A33Q_3624 [Indibacter alkaliphilus LW1]
MLTKNLLTQMCSELTGVSLLFKVKQNGFKILFVSREFLEWGGRNFEIQNEELLGLSLNQVIKLKKLPYLKGNDIKAALLKVVHEKNTVKEVLEYVDLNENQVGIINTPLLGESGEVEHILHQVSFVNQGGLVSSERRNASGIFEGTDAEYLFENHPLPVAVLNQEGKIKAINEAFVNSVFPLHKKNKLITEVFEVFSEINVSEVMAQVLRGKENSLDLKLIRDNETVYYTASLISIKNHVMAIFSSTTEVKKMRKDLVKKSMLMEDCLKFQKQNFELLEVREILKKSLSFMLSHSDAHNGLIWVKDLSLDEKLGHQSEFLYDQGFHAHRLNLQYLFDQDQQPIRNEPFSLRSNALANIGMLESSVSGFGKSILGICGRKSDHLLFVILLQMDATKVFDLEDKYVLNIVSSCIFSELAGVFSGRMISGEERF